MSRTLRRRLSRLLTAIPSFKLTLSGAAAIALVSAGFSGYLAFEARQSRKQSSNELENLRADTQKALKEQVEAMAGLVDQARKSASAAERSARLAERGLHMSVEPFIAFDFDLIAESKTPAVQVRFTNIGRGAAYEFEHSLYIPPEIPSKAEQGNLQGLRELPLPRESPFTITVERVDLGPGRTLSSTLELSRSKEFIAGILSGENSLLVEGGVSYKDEFDHKTYQDICVHYNSKSNSFRPCPQQFSLLDYVKRQKK